MTNFQFGCHIRRVRRASLIILVDVHGNAAIGRHEDIAIAATAHVHGLGVLTRNLRHFGPLGVKVADPFSALPELQ